MTFDTLLVAGGGETAVRVVRTARELGLRTVAVHADADGSAPHVRLADEAVRLAAAPAKDVHPVLRAAGDTGAGAVHPGGGPLSEDPVFARRCEDAGLVFVGPTPEQLEMFGARASARAAADALGVPPVPDPADPGEHTRRLEVQVFGDGEGLVVTFGDRDRPLRHRGRTVLTRAPAPDLPDHVRAQLAASARDLCAWADYRSAGTVEFVYDAAREEAYFLEVGTRLRPGHTVTEEVYGVDLVAWTLRLARGERGVVRAPGPPRGHAVGARLYAEHPARRLPSGSAPLTRAQLPPGVRVEDWGATGAGASAPDDPLLAEVIAHGCDRDEALRRLGEALAWTGFDGEGAAPGLGLVRAALTDPAFGAAPHATRPVRP